MNQTFYVMCDEKSVDAEFTLDDAIRTARRLMAREPFMSAWWIADAAGNELVDLGMAPGMKG